MWKLPFAIWCLLTGLLQLSNIEFVGSTIILGILIILTGILLFWEGRVLLWNRQG